MVSTQEQETQQLRALKLRTPIKGTFGLSTLTLTRAGSEGRILMPYLCNLLGKIMLLCLI